MNILLVAVNAKYIHSSLSIRSLKAYCEKTNPQLPVELAEFTINNRVSQILPEIFRRKPDIIGLSFYIWNVDMLTELSVCIKKVLPNTLIIAGGPEASYDPDALLASGADAVVIGEGEAALGEILSTGGKNLHGIPGVISAQGRADITDFPALPLNEIPFAYAGGLNGLENKIIYYETSRGCPYGCKYCLSGLAGGVRLLPPERVCRELDIFLRAKVKQVKLVDRTFNCNKGHALNIWKHLIENDNGVTNFHFEISAGILDGEMLDVLKNARPGLFQFEIGVQSTNSETLKLIGRHNDLESLFKNTAQIKKFGNIHQHLDLIAGLPGENADSFEKSFNRVYAAQPEQLQLGFLKLLKGSALRREGHGILFSDKAPYEVLATPWMGYGDIIHLKAVEEALEIYYNSGQFRQSIKFLATHFASPFQFYSKLGGFLQAFEFQTPGKAALFARLLEFAEINLPHAANILRELLRFDLCLNENPKAMPPFLAEPLTSEEKEALRRLNLLKNRSGSRVEKFYYTVADYAYGGGIAQKQSFVLFNYDGNPSPLHTGVHSAFEKINLGGEDHGEEIN